LERLLKFNAENVGLQRDLAAACGRIGTMQTLQGDLAGGLQSFEDCHALISRVAESDPRNIDWQSDRAVSHLKLAVGYMETKELLRALVAAESGRAIMLELLAQDPDQADWQRTLARFDQVIAALREM